MSEQLDNADNSLVPARRPLGIGTPWHGVRHHPVVSAFFVVSAIAAGCAVWVILAPPKTRTHVVFQVSAHSQALLNPTGDDKADFPLYCQVQAALVKSREVLNAALNQHGIANLGVMKNQTDRVAWLENNLQVDFEQSSELMRVSLVGDDSDDMKAILDAIKTVYIREVLSRDSMQRLSRLRQLEDVQRKYTVNLDDYRNKLGRIAEDLGSTDPANLALKEKFAQERIALAQRELLQIESEMRRATIEAKKLDEKLKNPDLIEMPQEFVDAEINKDQRYRLLAASQASLEESIKKLKSEIGPGSRPDALAGREEELAKAKKNLAEFADSIRPAVIARIKETMVVENKRSLMKLRDRMAVSNDLKKEIEADLARYALSLHRSVAGQIDLEAIRRDMDRLEHTRDLVQQQIEEVRPELDAPSRVTVWQEPVVVAGAQSNNRLVFSSIVLAVILVFGIGFVTLIEIALAGR